jgi:hypothetical protein
VGRVEVSERRGRRRKQLLGDLREMKEYWKMEKEVLDCTLWRTGFGSGYEPVVKVAGGDRGIHGEERRSEGPKELIRPGRRLKLMPRIE